MQSLEWLQWNLEKLQSSRKRLQLSLELLQTPLDEKQHNFILTAVNDTQCPTSAVVEEGKRGLWLLHLFSLQEALVGLYGHRVQCLTVAKLAFVGFQGGFKVDGI